MNFSRFRLIFSWLKYFLKYLLSFFSFLNHFNTWRKHFFTPSLTATSPRVCFGYVNIPGKTEFAGGGTVKFQRLTEKFPNRPESFNILYLCSSSLPKHWRQLLWLAKKRKAKIVLNQNGVLYPKHGPDWRIQNLPFQRLNHEADHVFYQSEFCRTSATQFLGSRKGPAEVLYNCVDTTFFMPTRYEANPGRLILLLGGNHCESYRVEVAIATLAVLKKNIRNVELQITGKFVWHKNNRQATDNIMRYAAELNVSDDIRLLGSYKQQDAPGIFQNAHILLHTQYNDASPGVVVEAMSCGLPVAYSASGGTPELVGPAAGIGVPAETNWQSTIHPDPVELAEAVLKIWQSRKDYSEAARQRVVECFDIAPWLERHRQVFDMLLH